MILGEKLKNISKDFVLNICATLILIGTMQLFVYPRIAQVCSVEEYGFFLTIMGAVNILAGTFGTGLNNVRLILNEDYHRAGVSGDYNILLACSLVLSFIVLVGASLFLQVEPLPAASVIALALLMILRYYLSVAYRLDINYFHVLVLNAVLAGGYVLATVWYVYVNRVSAYWHIVFLFGEIVAAAYLFKTTDLWREPCRRTKLFPVTVRKYLNLIYLSFIGGALMYFDRNLLLPLLGGEAVSAYFAATVIGKALGMFASPVSNVILSYLGQVGFKMSRSLYWKINGAISVAAVGCYGVTMLVVDWAVQLLYPSLYFVSKPYFWIANLVPIFTIVGDLARPTVVRYVSLDKLSVFNTGFLVLTCVVSCYSINLGGLGGFCYGAAGLALFRLAGMWILGDCAVR